MKFENTQVWGFEHALRGMRNPKESWKNSDSYWDFPERPDIYIIGDKDMKLAHSLIRGGSEHRKFLRQIFVSVDITAPMYWWSEFDTYKIGTVANSTSKMHKIASKPITIDCFEIDDYHSNLQLIDPTHLDVRVGLFIQDLEQLRQLHLLYLQKSQDNNLSQEERKQCELVAKQYWKELIRWLPEGWVQTRTLTFSYENLYAMCSKGQRRYHKLNEWSGIDDNTLNNFIKWARQLPYAQELLFLDELEPAKGRKILIDEDDIEKLRTAILKITSDRVDIKTNENNFKSISQILTELSQVCVS